MVQNARFRPLRRREETLAERPKLAPNRTLAMSSLGQEGTLAEQHSNDAIQGRTTRRRRIILLIGRAWHSFEAGTPQIAIPSLARALAFCIRHRGACSPLKRVKPVISAILGHLRSKRSGNEGGDEFALVWSLAVVA